MTRDEALSWLNEKVKTQNLVKHMLAAEAVMGALARRFGEDEQKWRMAGLLHDIDLDTVGKDMTRHGNVSADWLAEKGFPGDVVHAVRAHAGHAPAETRMDRALASVDPLTGLIVSAALIHPSKKIAGIDAAFVLKRFGEKRFAAGANREEIARCSEIGLTLDDFIAVGVEAMTAIAVDLGL
ncbi:MAG: HDIG domain-containing protein [Deltaproteobacteria bacterium]|nr:HDIG domain-containing protein [Deltaproteobacteria bacterium]